MRFEDLGIRRAKKSPVAHVADIDAVVTCQCLGDLGREILIEQSGLTHADIGI